MEFSNGQRKVVRSLLTWSVSSQLVAYAISLTSERRYAQWLSLRPGIGYPVFEYLTTLPGPLDDFYSYRFAADKFLLFPNPSGFTLYPIGFLAYQILSLTNEAHGAAILTATAIGLTVFGLSKIGSTGLLIVYVVTSWPVVFSISRGNNETLLFGVALAFVVPSLVEKSSKVRQFLSVLALTLLEPVPFWFFVSKSRRFWFAVSLGLTALVIIVFTGFVVEPHSPISYLQSLREFGGNHATNPYPGSSLFSTSLQSGVRTGYYVFGLTPPEYQESASLLNQAVFIIGCLALLVFGLAARFELTDRLILTTSTWLLCYSASFEYRLVWLLVPLALIVCSESQMTKLRVFQICLIALICTPKTFYWWQEEGGHHIGALFNSLLLLTLILATISPQTRFLRQDRKSILETGGFQL
jgi:hypothetical protein